MIYIAIKECRGCFLPESEKLLFRRNWQGLRESLLCFLAERCHNALCNADILGLVWAKGGFFREYDSFFKSTNLHNENIPKNQPELEI